MQTFSIDKKQKFVRELYNWVSFFVFISLLIIIISQFEKGILKNAWFIITVGCLIRLSNLVIPYHVNGLNIDKAENRLYIRLKSYFSGSEVKVFDLDKSSVSLKENKKYVWTLDPVTLTITATNKKYYKINSRYGFKPETLKK